LEKVHAVQPKCLDLDKCLGLAKLRLGNIGDVKGINWTLAIFDIFGV
jgi:hypothetical protein